MGPEATRFLKRAAEQLAAKTRGNYSHVILNNIRTKRIIIKSNTYDITIIAKNPSNYKPN